MPAETYFGIDLGTTYSCIACVKGGGEATVLTNNESQQTTPSVVFFENSDNVAVGNSAKQELRSGSEKAIARAKQFMGTSHSYEGYRPQALTPQEVSAYVLRKLVQDASGQIDGEVSDVVITCPAYFGLEAKAATKQAGELAGLKVHYVIPEPVAAAYYYATSREGSRARRCWCTTWARNVRRHRHKGERHRDPGSVRRRRCPARRRRLGQRGRELPCRGARTRMREGRR